MSIKIEIEAANGADARQQMLDLLGVTGTTVVQLPVVFEKKATEGATIVPLVNNVEPAKEETVNDEPKPEQNKRSRRTKAEIEAEKAALEANTGSEEPPASTENTAPVEEQSDMDETLLQDNKEQVEGHNDFEAFLKANPGEIEKQVEKFFSEPVEFQSVVSRDFMRGAAIVLGRKGKRDAVKEVMGNSSFSAQPGKEQVTDEQLNGILAKFVEIYQSI